MPTFYSDLYAVRDPFEDSWYGGTTPQVLDKQKRAFIGSAGARERYARCAITMDAVLPVDDGASQIRLKTFKSSDCVTAMLLTCTDSGDTGAIYLGLAETGLNHDGPMYVMDCFAVQDVSDGCEQVSVLSTGRRGVTLYEGTNGYGADPMKLWDLTMTAQEATTNTAWQVLVEVWFTSGG